ncbi:PilN domain-containing protein [Curvibacter sp. RS43]|uniref:PilN domain-containing protein n=1 Tax=Curvibacter microcysteis TaxID=3026419 RepID=A0ABT5MI73_9BURK|nr:MULTISPECIES: PilN domain-containing protein [unclassified Curvibacter]MDD0810323.1 PilN domain-containing protein [Curvibacter sp. RS43]MDD0816277.1 PilN domain-containing protein [Curvibacter sp. HBC28]
MILINLLPHREAARLKRKEAFQVALVGSAVLGGAVVAMVYLTYQSWIADQQGRNEVLKSEIRTLEIQIKEISNIEMEIAALKARQKAVEDLQSDRNAQTFLMNELVRQLPDGVYITSMKQDGATVLVQGVAQSNQRVSEVLKNFSSGSQWFAKPELLEIQAGSVSLSSRDQRRVANFGMRFQLLRASEVGKAAEAAAKK